MGITGTIKYVQLLLVVLLVAAGCSRPAKLVTKEDAIAFAKEIELTINKRNSGFLDDAIDKKEFIKRMALPKTSDARGFGNGVMETLKLGSKIVETFNDGDKYTFIKCYETNHVYHIIFRFFREKDAGLNYQDFELVMAGDKCKIADGYMYSTGEMLSETMHQMYFATLHNVGQEEEGLKKINEIKTLYQKGKSSEAKVIYNSLPQYLRKTKMVLLLNVYVSEGLSLAEYDEALKEFRDNFPNERSMNLMMIDGYYMHQDYVKMLAAVNALDVQINKDPLLDYHRFLSYKLLGQKDSSILCIKRLLNNMPDFQRAYIENISFELGKGNSVQADSLIAVYRKKPGFDQQRLNDIIDSNKK
ncbi:hypothetical protein [Ferruginibacter sp. SUN106]|uniref:hypothetical protein n=1 Tax=Ferruginibacter sp. SUN106 TaxID=2978348 RepID=UPI003D36CA84